MEGPILLQNLLQYQTAGEAILDDQRFQDAILWGCGAREGKGLLLAFAREPTRRQEGRKISPQGNAQVERRFSRVTSGRQGRRVGGGANDYCLSGLPEELGDHLPIGALQLASVAGNRPRQR